MGMMKLCTVVVVSSLVVACFGVETRSTDEAQYKNHRTSRNDTQTAAKFPVYEYSKNYVNISNNIEYTTVRSSADHHKSPLHRATAESPSDSSRVFGATNKKKVHHETSTAHDDSAVSAHVTRTSSPSVFLVTAKNVAYTSTTKSQKSPVYTPPATDARIAPALVVENNVKPRNRPLNGTKLRRVLKAQKQPTVLYAASSTQSPAVRNVTSAFVVAPKTNNNNNNSSASGGGGVASKPFATVFVPKQMLEGGGGGGGDNYGDSFRPIASPTLFSSYKQQSVVAADSNSEENDRRAAHVKTQTASTPVLTKYGFTKPPSYKVDEYHAHDQVKSFSSPPAMLFDRSFTVSSSAKRDRFDYHPQAKQTSGETEKPKREQAQRYDSRPLQMEQSLYDSTRYVTHPTESTVRSTTPKSAEPFRVFYPATELPPSKTFPPYAPKYDIHSSAPVEKAPTYGFADHSSGPPKEFSSAPTWFTSKNPTDSLDSSSAPEFVIDESNAKDVLKSLLRDMLKSKQQNEIKPSPSSSYSSSLLSSSPFSSSSSSLSSSPFSSSSSALSSSPFSSSSSALSSSPFSSSSSSMSSSPFSSSPSAEEIMESYLKSKRPTASLSSSSSLSGVEDIIESYLKSKRPAESFSPDNYDIDTDMSCNLRSTKYITDGKCVTTRPIVEAVCADRCLVYASSLPFNQRLRSSSVANQQVEALHCVDGDVKHLRVQLQCRDGNILNNIIKIVTNCRCKLHQIQPQMRSGSGPIPLSDNLATLGGQEIIMNPGQF